MKQISVRIRLQCSIAAEPTEHHFESLPAEDGSTPFDLLLYALKRLSLSYNDVDVLPPTMRDAEGATLGIADLDSPVSDGLTYEFALVKHDSGNPAAEENPNGSEHAHDSFDVLEATEFAASVGRSFVSRVGHGFAAAGNWMLNYLAPEVLPIEVISVRHDSEAQWPQMVLDTTALARILLDNVDARGLPVAIVSIAGIFRSGKSFLLNFFLRYLAHMEAVAAGRAPPEDDWFEPTDDDDGIHDRFHWAAGPKGVTKGIHMWPKPFVLRHSSGEKIAVVLVDSQGTEDLESDNGACVAVFALSTMIASLQIYNIKYNINKQTLLRLHEFTQFANEALGSRGQDHKHFQTLAFLVRDSDGDSGFDIGTAEVWRALKEGAMRQVGEDLALSFEEISGFMMPHPGKPIHRGLKEELHTYENVFKAMDSDFKQSVKDFTQTMLNPDSLRTKQVNGEMLTCESALNYIKKWGSSFRDCRMPPPTTFFDATAEVHNQRAVDCAIKAYAGYTRKRFNNAQRPYPVADLLQIHEDASGDAYRLFSVKSIGEYQHKEHHLRRLDELIKVEHAAFKKINANLAVPVAWDTYDALWEDFIARQKQRCVHYHLNRAAFADKDHQHRTMASAKFYEFAVRGDDSALDAVGKLEHELKVSVIERKVNNGRNCYKHIMTTAQYSDEPWVTSRLQSCHKEAKKKAFDGADLSRHDAEFALAREHLKRQIKVAKASFITPDMPGDKNVHAWDQAIAHYIKRMDRVCKLYVSHYLEPHVFKEDSSRFIDEAKTLFKDRCENDSRSPEFEETLMHEIARHQDDYEKINNKNWWWQAYKKVATFFGAPFAVFKRRIGRGGSGQQPDSGDARR